MRRIITFVIALLMSAGVLMSAASPTETLNYKVLFKWGLINKKAGTATLTLTPHSSHLKAALYARSEPWADSFYKLRDTLYSHMEPTTMVPKYYERIAYEDGKYARDVIHFHRSGNNVTANTERYRRKGDNAETSSVFDRLTASGVTVDMLSAFYYLRTLDFAGMTPGQSKTVNIFSAKRKEQLRIVYHGEETLKIGKKSYSTWHVSFRFTTDGAKKSSDDIDTWIDTTGHHAPVKLRGKLKIGSILCLLEP